MSVSVCVLRRWRLFFYPFLYVQLSSMKKLLNILPEFDNQRYRRGEDSDEYWIKPDSIQTRVRSLGVEIGPRMVVNKFLSSLPAEYTTLRDN